MSLMFCIHTNILAILSSVYTDRNNEKKNMIFFFSACRVNRESQEHQEETDSEECL